MFKAGKMPCKAVQLPTGTIIVYPDEPIPRSQAGKIAIYARVATDRLKGDLVRQLELLRGFAASQGFRIETEKKEIGMGDNLPQLQSLLKDGSIKTILVEYPDRISRFSYKAISDSLLAEGRLIIPINGSESQWDLVDDFKDVVLSMCNRIDPEGLCTSSKELGNTMRALAKVQGLLAVGS